MAKLTLKGNPIHTIGELPNKGTQAPNFVLTKNDLSETQLADFKGQQLVLNIFPSLDTPTCAASVRKFNEKAGQITGVKVLCISADLPFAQKRFCTIENLQNVIALSEFRHPEFGKDYGVTIVDGPLSGLLSRAIVVIDADGKVNYTQQVAEIADEPDYDAALNAIK